VRRIPALPFARSEQDRVVAGVCGGVAAALDVDANLVRFVFALLALAGGAGILLYLALWVYSDGERPLLAVVLVALATMALLVGLGFSAAVVVGAGLLVAGIVVLARRGASLRPGGSLGVPGIALVAAGSVVILQHIGASHAFVAPGAVAGALALVLAPWLWQLASERTERIRLAERAEVAARVHDSVLQTLALVQRHAADPARVAALARRQERDLRRWLYGGGFGAAATFADALADAVADIEAAHGVRVELATAGDAALDDSLGQLVLAAREAMTNAAKHSGADEVFVFAEVEPDRAEIFVRDRGRGFDRAAVPADRRGLAESVEARMTRAGGAATITSVPGEGTEVELTLPRGET
jgi:signal transduction histidine kinase